MSVIVEPDSNPKPSQDPSPASARASATGKEAGLSVSSFRWFAMACSLGSGCELSRRFELDAAGKTLLPGRSCIATMVHEIQAPHVGFKFADRAHKRALARQQRTFHPHTLVRRDSHLCRAHCRRHHPSRSRDPLFPIPRGFRIPPPIFGPTFVDERAYYHGESMILPVAPRTSHLAQGLSSASHASGKSRSFTVSVGP
jgi:hypothetical protein